MRVIGHVELRAGKHDAQGSFCAYPPTLTIMMLASEICSAEPDGRRYLRVAAAGWEGRDVSILEELARRVRSLREYLHHDKVTPVSVGVATVSLDCFHRSFVLCGCCD